MVAFCVSQVIRAQLTHQETAIRDHKHSKGENLLICWELSLISVSAAQASTSTMRLDKPRLKVRFIYPLWPIIWLLYYVPHETLYRFVLRVPYQPQSSSLAWASNHIHFVTKVISYQMCIIRYCCLAGLITPTLTTKQGSQTIGSEK